MTTALEERPITRADVQAHGLTPFEYQRIVELLGREPGLTELGVFSLMWSEHCGYKYSRARLVELPTTGPQVIQGPGENAGAVDVGDELAVVFKMESHNHPSAVEPYQGAATGVGGILRDVFTMGARPIALLDSLRFGELDDPHVRYLFRHVVRGVGDYGNCVGVPTVGGEVVFDDAYRGNPLVNAMCVGIVRHEELTGASAGIAGNAVYVLGSRTGRDGIHGASLLASSELGDDAVESRPTVQVGDPFTEKLLLEATLELIGRGVASGIQDLGAAGLTSSSAEMASRAGTGIEIDVAKVPRREPDMTAYEVLLSESQERMLISADAAGEPALMEVADKWDLPCTRVGRVTGDGVWRILEGDSVVCEIPVRALTDDVPRYLREVDPPPYVAEVHAGMPDPDQLAAIDPWDALETLLAASTIASKRWVWEQYDHTVQASTVAAPGADAAIVRIRGTDRGLALAVAEAARNLAAVGARPLAITDCLNFGNPEKDAVYWQFAEAIRGISEACRALDTPVVSGNVSFYNESSRGAIHPTPTIGMVGVVDLARTILPGRGRPGDLAVLVGGEGSHLGATSLLKEVLGLTAGRAPAVDLDAERRLGEAVRELAGAGLVRSAHDLSDGGLGVAAAELLFGHPRETGLDLELPAGVDPVKVLFAEDAGRILLVIAAENEADVSGRLSDHGLPVRVAGRLTGTPVLRIAALGHRRRLDLEALWQGTIPRIMQRTESSR